jgi:hypothetical protein
MTDQEKKKVLYPALMVAGFGLVIWWLWRNRGVSTVSNVAGTSASGVPQWQQPAGIPPPPQPLQNPNIINYYPQSGVEPTSDLPMPITPVPNEGGRGYLDYNFPVPGSGIEYRPTIAKGGSCCDPCGTKLCAGTAIFTDSANTRVFANQRQQILESTYLIPGGEFERYGQVYMDAPTDYFSQVMSAL